MKSELEKQVIAEKTHDFGKFIIGRKAYKVSITCRLYEKEEGKVFSATGKIVEIGNRHEYGSYGQNIKEIHDLIYKYSDDTEKLKLVDKIYNSWSKYHLNDMHAGTKKQEKFIKSLDIPEDVNRYSFIKGALKAADLYEDKDITVYKLVVLREEYGPLVLASTYTKTSTTASFADIQKLYKEMLEINKMEDAMNFVNEHFHVYGTNKELVANAILKNDMSIESHGYEYGHSWLFEKIPAKALKTIEELTGYKEKEKKIEEKMEEEREI